MTISAIDVLVGEGRLREAAGLAEAAKNFARASALYEEACLFTDAVRMALAANDIERATLLAAITDDESILKTAAERLDDEALARVAGVLGIRGKHRAAAILYERLAEYELASEQWERAGDLLPAASAMEHIDVVRAARILETALRREPTRTDARITLGRILAQHGKWEAAVRHLQQVPDTDRSAREALSWLVIALEQLGMATDELRERLNAMGGAMPIADISPHSARGKLFGRYNIVRETASTPTARVVEAIDAVGGEHVAVKLFVGHDSFGVGRDALSRFEREVRVLRGFAHPNIVALREYLPEGPAIVMPWLGGGTLETQLQAGAIAPARAVEIASSILSALAEAHRMGIIHRDLKPSNVLFDDAGTAKLCDFGVAHLGDLSRTATRGMLGTFEYMSPEQRRGEAATVQSDIYGVGALFYEMLTGARLTTGDGARVLPSGVHRELTPKHDQIALAMIADDPLARPSDAILARRALFDVSWPGAVELLNRPKAPERPAPATASRWRQDGSIHFDTLLEREVERLPLTEANAIRIRAFAAASHPMLQAVLAVDHADAAIWLESSAPALSPKPLTDDDLQRLTEAVRKIHEAGGVHGAIEKSVCFSERYGWLLRFSSDPAPEATRDGDLQALTRLLPHV